MKILYAIARVKENQPISPATFNILITDASILLLLLITIFKILS